MQDIQSIGGGGRLFGGGGDRRLRPHHHQNHQPLKCPRCDSLNTKFCYYNNYNLSQPRHFCKSCRRYWTKGGVLRNVPVGGGCRKTKRSKPKSGSSSQKEHKSNSHSSSESSSLTANTTAATTTTAAPSSIGAPAEVASSSSSTTALLNFQDSRFFVPQTMNSGFDPALIDQPSTDGGGDIFPEIGSFTSMMTSSNDPSPMLGFNIGDIPSYRLQQSQHGEAIANQGPNHHLWQHPLKIGNAAAMADGMKIPDLATGFLDQTTQVEFSGGLQSSRTTGNGGGALGALDWQGGADQGLFDLTGTVDQAYWSQTQWSTDTDHSLNYLP